MALQLYRAKRDFRRTPEPRGGKRVPSPAGLSYVIQKHAASHLHYDFRLELNGVLLSWAVPKGPSLDPADKRLAIQVEDHPMEYGGFEGIIPKGEYGGGSVVVWDRGTWEPRGQAALALAKGSLKFTLHGEKLKGNWALVRTRGSKYGGKTGDKAWLLIKETDDEAQPGGKSVVAQLPDSVVTGRSVEDVANERAKVWHSTHSVKAKVRSGPLSKAPIRKELVKVAPAPGQAAGKTRMPPMISPVLATLVKSPPEGDHWISEIKYDGYRMVCRVHGKRAQLFSRSARDWTQSLESVARDLAQLPVKSAWIDGEVVVLDAAGRSDFQALQNALQGTAANALTFFAFDLMYLDGFDLRKLPLTERKALLRKVVGDGVGTIKVGPEVRGGGEEFFRQACALGLEGAVCKRADSPYRSGTRSREWVKVKCTRRQEMVIGGYTDPQGARQGFGALLLGYYDGGDLRYAGKVGTGFSDNLLRELGRELPRRKRVDPSFVNPPQGFEAKGAHWIRPDLVAEVAFTDWSDDGLLRHPSFQGLRRDKSARDVVRDVANDAKAIRTTGGAKANGFGPLVASPQKRRTAKTEIVLTHPEKLYFPETHFSKGDLARYQVQMAEHILPHLDRRPLSLVRCPDGWGEQCFYQKHADPGVGNAVTRVDVPDGKGTATYLCAGTREALVALVQWGVIELHPWGSKSPKLDRPDRLIFDLDPDETLAWKDLVTGVGLLRTLLEEMELTGFLKTTGGKGLHVVLPIRPTLTWDEAKSFTKTVASLLANTFPERFTTSITKQSRKGRIFVDYLRNAQGATAVAPYTVRARKNAPVATPIDWTELKRDVRFDFFNVRNVPQRLGKLKQDPWAAFFHVRQTITASLRKRLA